MFIDPSNELTQRRMRALVAIADLALKESMANDDPHFDLSLTNAVMHAGREAIQDAIGWANDAMKPPPEPAE